MILPAKISLLLLKKTGHANTVGMSGSSVTVYDDLVLKVDRNIDKSRKTAAVMQWLEGRIPAAQLIAHEITGGKSWLLMSKVAGKMCCNKYYMEQSEVLLRGLTDALKLLWSTDSTGCPRTTTISDLLKEAEYRVEQGLVDVENTEPDTFGPGGFRNPEHLLHWLTDNKAESHLSLSHGDFCLPNIFMDQGRFSGFIDLDDFGIGEKWRDIALCWRSLKHNCDGHYGNIYNIDPNCLFDLLEIQPDWDLIHYHLLLDELF